MEEKKEEREKNEEAAEIAKSTLEKLRPHFLFNVLNQMKYLARKNPQLVEEMVYDLANFFRGSLTVASLEEETSLDEELRAFKSYLRLECAMNRHMELEVALSDEKNVRRMMVKPGVLQEFGAKLVKDKIRTTKEIRTVVVTDTKDEDWYYIQVEIRELGQTYCQPVARMREE